MTPTNSPAEQRLDVLDGMRGLAALLVVAYHFFSRWAEPQFTPTLYAHGDAVATFPPLQVAGNVGVQLFFLISGFVIMMTLERASGVLDFAAKRIARLWPTMLICATLSTVLINASGVAYVYENVARWQVTPVEYFSSIFFIPPDLIAGLLNVEQSDTPRWVEGVYWTLWCEVRFYALIACVVWISPRTQFLWVWFGIQSLSFGLDILLQRGYGNTGVPMAVGLILQPEMLGLFTLGLVGWKWRTLGPHPALIALTIIASLSILLGPVISLQDAAIALSDNASRALLALAMIGVPFALFLRQSRILKPLTWPPLIAVGLASYPLYLFHERPGMIYMNWLNDFGIHPWITVVLAIAIVICTALLIHRFAEDPGKRMFLRLTMGATTKLQTRFRFLRMPGNRS